MNTFPIDQHRSGARRVLGLDPGSTFTGWAVLREGETRRQKPTFLRGGRVANEGLWDLLRDCERDTLIAIESPAGHIFSPARGAQLLATKGVASEIAGAAKALGFKVWEKPCAHVRKVLCQRATAGDRVVKTALPVFVDGLPKRSNSHVRDAIAVAAVALMH